MSKILVLTTREIFPIHGGDKLRIYQICKHLSRYHDLDILSLTEDKNYSYADYVQLNTIFNNCRTVYHNPLQARLFSLASIFSKHSVQEWYYYNPTFKKIVDSISDNYDYILIHLFRLEQYVKGKDLSKVHIELTDAISMNYQKISFRRISNFMELLYYIDRKKILRRELEIIQKYNSVSLISGADKKYLNLNNSAEHIRTFKNGVDLKRFPTVNGRKDQSIIFIGNIGTTQNSDACRYFINDILPEINKIFPSLKFKIIGIIPDDLRKEFESNKNVIVTGRVKSIQQAAGNPLLAVCPMRYGAGIQNKVLEYLAMGIPVISSKLGMEGLEELKNYVYIANNSGDYVKATIDILEEKDLKKVDPVILRSKVKKYYSWEHALNGYEDLFSPKDRKFKKSKKDIIQFA